MLRCKIIIEIEKSMEQVSKGKTTEKRYFKYSDGFDKKGNF